MDPQDWTPEAIDRLIAAIREQHALQQWQLDRRTALVSTGRSTRYGVGR